VAIVNTSLPQKAVAAHQPESASDDLTPLRRGSIQGHAYMMRSGKRYKIGHTNSPARRHREVRLDLPDPTTLVHCIKTDDPSGIEAYWHRRFASKRVRDTEFFGLDASDIAAFRRRKYQ
jgi:Meiotically up-regulated gene 113